MKKRKTIFIIIILMLVLLFIIRLISQREIDDIHPKIPCENEYVKKADILWVIPIYNNTPISNNKSWCKQILALNKTLGMHGIYHSYHEFENYVNESQLIYAKQIFKECFGYEPTLFKPPYLRLTKENKELLEKNNLEIKWIWNQNFHKVYHCRNDGIFPNRFHDIF
jgi:predicted deacetylase